MPSAVHHGVDFSLQRPRGLQTPDLLFPGDWLETVCTFENDEGAAIYGIRAEAEVCQNCVIATPVGPLDSGGGISYATHACMLRLAAHLLLSSLTSAVRAHVPGPLSSGGD